MDLWPWLVVVVLMAGLAGGALLLGSRLPRQTRVSRSLLLPQPPATVWRVIGDLAQQPAWRPGLIAVERLADRAGREVWRETYAGGERVELVTVEATPPRWLVRQLASAPGLFQGRWEFDLTSAPGGCLLTLTEVAEVPVPVLRLVARLASGPASFVESYLVALAVRLTNSSGVP
jgi:hypothetical protein